MKKLLIMMIPLFLLMPAAFAVKVSSLYQAEITVPSQAADAREQAIREAFLQVLVKVSGDAQIDQNPDVRPAFKTADYYVQEYSYLLPSPTASQYTLLIRFNKQDINRLLRRAGVAYWGENRPLILVWLAVRDLDHSTAIVDSETPNGMAGMMKQHSKRYGLPLIFPMMDMEDVDQVTSADVTAMAVPVLKAAGKRYSPDALLIGKLSKTEVGYQSQWQLVLGNNQWQWTIAASTPAAIVDDVLNRVSQTFVKRYVVKAAIGPGSWLTLEVSNITQHRDLVQLMQYLQQLSPVQQVRLSQVSGGRVELAVEVRGSLTTFQQNATIGQHLVLKAEEAANHKLIYEWTR